MRHRALLATFFFISVPFLSSAGQGFGVGLRAGSLGGGVDLTISGLPIVNARLGANFMTLSFDGTEGSEDIAYDVSVNFLSFSALVDFHPGGSGFRLSLGGFLNQNEAEGVLSPSKTYSLGSQTYSPERLGDVTVKLTPELAVSPYAGIGWGNAAKGGRVGFSVDLGALYFGSPEVEATGSGMIAPTAEQAPIIQDAIRDVPVHPVLMIGLNIRL